MSDHQTPPDRDAFNARLKAAQDERAEKEDNAVARRQSAKGAGIGMRIGIELLAAVLVGGGIGLFIDKKLETSPIFTLAFTVLGFTAGVMDVLRVLKGLDTSVGLGRAVREKEARDAQAPPNAWDDDD
jgi:ATP synthase protein I